MPCATHKHDRTTAGWKRPTTGQKRRRALAKRCPTAFMVKTKAGDLKFPVVPEHGASCCLDCRAARVAAQRAGQHHKRYPGLYAKIRARAKTAGCDWAQGAPRAKAKRKTKARRRR